LSRPRRWAYLPARPDRTTDANPRKFHRAHAQAQKHHRRKAAEAAGELMNERNSIDIPERAGEEVRHQRGTGEISFRNKDACCWRCCARDSQSEIENLDYLMRQPISPTEKLRLHIAGIIKAYHRFPYLNRLIRHLVYESNGKSAREVSRFFAKPVFEFQEEAARRRICGGEFRKLDPALFNIV